MKILYIGILELTEDCARNPICNASNNRFQWELLTALAEAGCAIHVLALRASDSRQWKYRPFRRLSLTPSLTVTEVPFFGSGVLQPLSQSVAISQALIKELITWKPEAMITDIHYARYGVPALLAYFATRIPLVTILSDTPHITGWRRFLPRQFLELLVIQHTPAAATLSNHVTRDYRPNRLTTRISVPASRDVFKLSLDREYFETKAEKIVYFAGTFNIYSGIPQLLDAIKLIFNPDYRFWFSGRGPLEKDIIALAKDDKRVKLWGFIEREPYLRLMEKATILVNPRPSVLPASRYNFPSKLMEYMAAGRPLVSTSTSDINEVYKDVVVLVEDDTGD